jgi:lipoprotein-releasing system permease protein
VNIALFIARKYFFSKKKKTFINVISIISMLVVGISTMAMIIVLSVFNGLEGLLRNLYGQYDPDITVVPTQGKTFSVEEAWLSELREIDGVESVAEVIEDNVLVRYKDAQRVVRMKGLSDAFIDQRRIQDYIVDGQDVLKKDNIGYAIAGRGIQYALSLSVGDDFHPLQVYYPRDIQPGRLNPSSLFSLRSIRVGGIFAVEKYYDENYIFVPLEFMQELLKDTRRRTSLEIQVKKDAAEVKKALQEFLGPAYNVRLNEEIHGDLYKILKWEKIFVFLTFGLIIAIGSINIYFSLSMLVIDKKKDLAILQSLGAGPGLRAKVFLAEGAIIAFSGGLIGLVLGLGISWLQQTYGIVSIGVPGALTQAYPVAIEWLDVLLITLLIIGITLVAAIQPARKASAAQDLSLLQ